MALIYASPDNIRPNRDRINELTPYDFVDMYIPICNDSRPFDSPIKLLIGDVVWNKQDFALLGNYLGEKRIWAVNKISDTKYEIHAGVRISDQTNLLGYIITEIPYNRNDIGVLKIEVDLETDYLPFG